MNARLRFALKEAVTLPFHALGLCLRPFRARAIRRLWHLGNLRARVGWVSPRLQLDGPVTVAGTGRITFPLVARLGPDVYLETCGRGRIVLGENVRLNQGTVIVAYDRVEIGRDTLVGEYVTIRDANHGLRPGAPIRSQPHEARPVLIGEDVWIGRGVCVLAGVTLGRGAVVGANSVVNRALPPYSVAAGIPARVVRSRRPAESREQKKVTDCRSQVTG